MTQRCRGALHRLSWLLLLAALWGCAATGRGRAPAAVDVPGSATVVRATWHEAPLPGARIEWRRDISPDGGDLPVVSTTDAKGIARSTVPPGRWFLLAQWRADGDFVRSLAPGDRFAFFGGNPVFLSGGASREIFLGLTEFQPPPHAATPAASDDANGISGVVTADGVPLADAHVFAYIRTDTAFRDMGFAASSPTGAGGDFHLDLPPGRYWLVARKRASGAMAGPLRKGDAFGYYPANPVEVVQGKPVRVTLPATTLRLRNVPGYAASSETTASIEGRILGVDGRPRAGVYAALYDNPDLLNRPLFISDLTGADGRYNLPVPEAGVYYLGARSGYGGSPAPGDLYGRYEGNPGHSITVGNGDRLTGVDLVVSEVR